MLSYTILPNPPDGFLTITDCVPSDRPRQKHPGPYVSQETNDVCSIGIIGIPRGATSTASGGGNEGKLQVACSALHFEPVDEVKWCIVFHEKRCKDITLELI